MLQADLEDKCPACQQDERMDQTPQPAGYGADEPLFEVAPDELKKEGSAGDQISDEMPTRYRRHGLLRLLVR